MVSKSRYVSAVLVTVFHISSISVKDGVLMGAPKAKISNLECHDVNVRVMGDFAIIPARTSYALAVYAGFVLRAT